MQGDETLTLCDLTQSWSPSGGGISTYLAEKRRYIAAETDHRHVLIVPGETDRVIVDGRLVHCEVEAPPVRGSPNYRFILNLNKVRALLAEYRPDLIESLCPWVLPWAVLQHRQRHPETATVAGYRTDFPNAHVYRVGRDLFGHSVAAGARSLSYAYARWLYRRFDAVYTLNETAAGKLRRLGVGPIDILPLGVDSDIFHPAKRDLEFRRSLGVADDEPLLIYAGRVDNEKRVQTVVDAFMALPGDFRASLLIVGVGKLMDSIREQTRGRRVHLPGFKGKRRDLARALASSDIYVSGMADETFGISVIEAQACGLPVIGVASGAMTDRVPAGLGHLVPVDDGEAMAAAIQRLWREDAKAAGRRARQHVLDNFTWDRTFQTLINHIYVRALSHGARRSPRARLGRPGILPTR